MAKNWVNLHVLINFVREEGGSQAPNAAATAWPLAQAILVESPAPPGTTKGRASTSAKFELAAACGHGTGHEFRMFVFNRVRATVSGATSRTSFRVTDQSWAAGRFWRMFMPYVMDGASRMGRLI